MLTWLTRILHAWRRPTCRVCGRPVEAGQAWCGRSACALDGEG